MSLLPHLGLALALFGSVSGAAPHSARSAARSPTGTAAESCGPSFAEIYDFQVGDIFQDTWSPPASIGGNGEIVRSLDRKYRIVSRERLPDRYRYGVDLLTYAPAVRYPVPPNPVDLPEAFGATHETWEFRDSAAASLDACPDRMVPLTDFPAILGGSG